jgi:hypothetical protein
MLQEARVSIESWESEHFNLFCTKWGGAAAEYALSIFPHRERWALAYASVFLAGRTGNTTAEQGMHSVVSWFSENKDHVQAISTLVQMDVERHRRLQWDLAEMRGKLPLRLSKIRQPDLKACTETFSDHALSLLHQQIQQAVN